MLTIQTWRSIVQGLENGQIYAETSLAKREAGQQIHIPALIWTGDFQGEKKPDQSTRTAFALNITWIFW